MKNCQTKRSGYATQTNVKEIIPKELQTRHTSKQEKSPILTHARWRSALDQACELDIARLRRALK